MHFTFFYMFLDFMYFVIIVYCRIWFVLLFDVIKNLVTYQTQFCKINCRYIYLCHGGYVFVGLCLFVCLSVCV